ncbi:Succinate--CoA ligase subunit beta [Cladobotryum mycophilum]|uniref:Succinate--CoA ligase subunit beta n=1 Tax=Cladobotryum mycophilum TaxID=491253 RepID=A0ABR0SSU2_9HYPO
MAFSSAISTSTKAAAKFLTGSKLTAFSACRIRNLTLRSYQSQNLLKEVWHLTPAQESHVDNVPVIQYGIPVPQGIVAQSPAEVYDAIHNINHLCVLKAQLLHPRLGNAPFESGLRGGYHTVQTPDQGRDVASRMLGHKIIEHEQGNVGTAVNQVYVSKHTAFRDKWYLAMTVDREHYSPVIIISKNGGEDVQAIAERHPESLYSFNFSLSQGITQDLVAQICATVGTSSQESANLQKILVNLYTIFREKDATLLEVNPLAASDDGTLTCLDSRFSFDDDATRRQPDIFSLRDKDQEVKDEVEAEKYGLVYIRLDGNIGNIVNGAGLAMATNDAIGLHGGASANFLDAGGQATKETMQQALGIVLRDERVKSVLISIYGGITRCDMIAESIIGAAQEMDLSVPIVIRLQGTNSVEGLKLLADANLGLHVESDFGLAAQRAVELANSS